VVRAMERRTALMDPERMKQDALLVLQRISQGELDPSSTRAALAQLREADRAITKRATCARTIERDLDQRRRREASRIFTKAAHAVLLSRRNGRAPLSPEQRTELIFARYAPIVPAEPVGLSLPAAEPDAHAAEIAAFVRTQSVQGNRRSPEPHEAGPHT